MPGSNTEQQSSVEHARVVAEANAAGRTKAWDICGPSTTSSIIVYTPESPRRSAERSPPPLFLFVINVRSWGTEKLCWGQLSAGYLVWYYNKGDLAWIPRVLSCRSHPGWRILPTMATAQTGSPARSLHRNGSTYCANWTFYSEPCRQRQTASSHGAGGVVRTTDSQQSPTSDHG